MDGTVENTEGNNKKSNCRTGDHMRATIGRATIGRVMIGGARSYVMDLE
jgi:hypothetical protein